MQLLLSSDDMLPSKKCSTVLHDARALRSDTFCACPKIGARVFQIGGSRMVQRCIFTRSSQLLQRALVNQIQHCWYVSRCDSPTHT